MCDIAQISMKEEALRAICNICVIMFVMGLLLICLIHTNEANIAAFALMATACGAGFICGALLDQLQRYNNRQQRRRMEINEQDDKDIRSGRFNYVLDYSFDQYLKDNDTDIGEVLRLIDDPDFPPDNYGDVYDHYLKCAPECRHEPKEMVFNRMWEGRYGK